MTQAVVRWVFTLYQGASPGDFTYVCDHHNNPREKVPSLQVRELGLAGPPHCATLGTPFYWILVCTETALDLEKLRIMSKVIQ